MLVVWTKNVTKTSNAGGRRRKPNVSNVSLKSIKSRAIRHADNVLQNGTFDVRDIIDRNPILEQAENFEWTLSFPKRGWAHRENLAVAGELGVYGKSYMSEYKNETAELFESG